jgi:rubrerythrin
MTREEAITYANCLKNNYTINFDDMADFCDMAIKALEQEPCEDCISREQAKSAIRDRFKDLPSRVEINTILNELPSVTPQPKIGHWVRQTDDYHDYYECEYCGIAVGLDDIKNYCPNCGAKMVESEL